MSPRYVVAALVALLALSLGFGHSLVELIYIPSCIINILAPLTLITILTRRTWASIALITLMGYAHLGISYLAAFGLVEIGRRAAHALRTGCKKRAIEAAGLLLVVGLGQLTLWPTPQPGEAARTSHTWKSSSVAG